MNENITQCGGCSILSSSRFIKHQADGCNLKLQCLFYPPASDMQTIVLFELGHVMRLNSHEENIKQSSINNMKLKKKKNLIQNTCCDLVGKNAACKKHCVDFRYT